MVKDATSHLDPTTDYSIVVKRNKRLTGNSKINLVPAKGMIVKARVCTVHRVQNLTGNQKESGDENVRYFVLFTCCHHLTGAVP
jgi:hypothetical protein